MYAKKLILSLAACIALSSLQANNIQVSNISVQSRNTTTKTTMIHFDVSWENSWRTSSLESNWDSAWVFVKYRVKGQSVWKHATIATSGNTGPSSCTIDTVSDGKGAFVKASADMALSNVNYQGIELKWRYGFDGLHDNDSAEICVYGIEMVYVPQGAFYAGDGNGTSLGSFTSLGSTANDPYYISSENAISDLAGKDAVGDIPLATASSSPSVPASFPKGYAGFYCMKYELTQGQYVAFLNKLTSSQVTNGSHAMTSGFARNTVSGSWPNYSAAAPHRAYNYIKAMSATAYADWAGLRPMTELEYEKACRGTLSPITDELAWGDTNLVSVSSALNDGLINETASNAANAHLGATLYGPLRNGWAGTSPATRANTGSTYYGIAEMTGNLAEIVVDVSTSSGRSFDGANNGDGNLDTYGSADVTSWPVFGSDYCRRGGGWYSSKTDSHVSSRDTSGNAQNGYWDNGFRCVRTYTY